MFSENILLYQQDLQLHVGPYFVKWQLAIYYISRVAHISHILFNKIIIVAQIPRVV